MIDADGAEVGCDDVALLLQVRNNFIGRALRIGGCKELNVHSVADHLAARCGDSAFQKVGAHSFRNRNDSCRARIEKGFQSIRQPPYTGVFQISQLDGGFRP
jgi:hypothetical protein